MPRHLGVYSKIEQLRDEASELLDAFCQGQHEAIADFSRLHPTASDTSEATIEDARLVLAQDYGVVSWSRLEIACEMVNAIWQDDVDRVERLVNADPDLLDENATGVDKSNWGPPMSYAANLGRDRIVQMLFAAGAKDTQHAFDRACLQGKVDTAKWLHAKGAELERGIVMGACETQNADGLEMLLDMGAEFCDAEGNPLMPVAMLLGTYCRNPNGKHRALELAKQQGVAIPDTPVMALHRGRTDLLEEHLRRDPKLLSRRFAYREIYPPELGCPEDETLALHGTPIANTTLLHLCVDFDEMEIAEWLIENNANVNATAEIDADGFGGHTPIFNAAVSQANACGRQKDAAMARLLIENGAKTNLRVSIRKSLRFVDDESMHEYHRVTPLEYARSFQDKRWTCDAVNELLSEHQSLS